MNSVVALPPVSPAIRAPPGSWDFAHSHAESQSFPQAGIAGLVYERSEPDPTKECELPVVRKPQREPRCATINGRAGC